MLAGGPPRPSAEREGKKSPRIPHLGASYRHTVFLAHEPRERVPRVQPATIATNANRLGVTEAPPCASSERAGPLALATAAAARLAPRVNDDLQGHNASETRGAVDLYWIPLGAGAHVVRVSGKVFEAISALVQRRRRCDLYHSALEVRVPEGRFVIEQTPVPDLHGEQRGVVARRRGGNEMGWTLSALPLRDPTLPRRTDPRRRRRGRESREGGRRSHAGTTSP